MKYTITLDTGTTNSRTILWDSERHIIGKKSVGVGVRNTAIDGNNNQLKKAVKDCIHTLLADAEISFGDLSLIIASGMITSNVGLVEIPHITAPAGINELARAVTAVLLEDVAPIPIHFIPGIKNNCPNISVENFECMDIMRGEEVESCAILEKMEEGNQALLVLPGSHTKFISVDDSKRITGCLTSISGELLSSITKDTILADAVGRAFVEKDNYDFQWVKLGFETAQKTGLGRSCFSGRILNQFVTEDHTKIANFILGVVLQNDFLALAGSNALSIPKNAQVIIAGKEPLRTALRDLFLYVGYFSSVTEFIPDADLPLSAIGSYVIADRKRRLDK